MIVTKAPVYCDGAAVAIVGVSLLYRGAAREERERDSQGTFTLVVRNRIKTGALSSLQEVTSSVPLFLLLCAVDCFVGKQFCGSNL